MSHATVLVLTATGTGREVEALLERYYENKEVPEYEETCWCVGRVAKNAASSAVEKAGGGYAALRERFAQHREALLAGEEVLGITNLAVVDITLAGEERVDALWKKMIEPITAEIERREKAHRSYNKPDKKCGECKGSGRRMTTSNPDRKWDWWVIGGRWTGRLFGDYDPKQYPENFETCDLCAGTGTRPDGVARFGAEWAKSYNGCNGCQGTGQRVKDSPSSWVNVPPNVIRVRDLSEQENPFIPYAVVTPNGQWHQRGQLGWFGLSSDEKESKDWESEVKAFYATYPAAIAVLVDYHI